MARNSGLVVDKKGWEKMKKNLLRGSNKTLDIGWFGGKMHSNNRSNSPAVSLAQLASWLEIGGHTNGGWGAGTITPPRPFIRAGLMVWLKQDKAFASMIGRQFTSVALGTSTWDSAYREMGPQLAKVLQRIMWAWNNPVNGPMTVSLKGFNNPLVETGELIESVDWRVENRGT